MKELITSGHLRIADLALHKNRGMELTYITKGRMEWVVDGRIETVRQGDIFFTLPWQLHGSPVLQQPENEAWHLLFRLPGDYRRPRTRFELPASLGFTAAEARLLSRTFAQARRHAWPAGPQLRELFPWMIREFERGGRLSRANGRQLLATILVELSRQIRAEATAVREGSASEQRVRQFLERLAEDCDEDWTLHTMARACGVQRTRFHTLVHQISGLSPMRYLAQVRVDRARRLLRETDRSVTDIALSCGFSSSQYFANVFRKHVGLAPSDYRARYPELYDLDIDADQVPWRSIEEERQRVAAFGER